MPTVEIGARTIEYQVRESGRAKRKRIEVTPGSVEVIVPEGSPPAGVRIKDQKTLWGSCGKDRVIRLDRKLIRVPKPVLEYVVVHEMCHLRHRTHSEAFWGLIKELLPDFEERKRWLERHEVGLE